MSDDAIERARRLVALDCATCDCDWSGEACRDLLSRDETATLLAALDASRREVERLRAGVRSVADDLTEHAEDGDCAGPHGTGRRGACADCRAAMYLRALLDQPVRPAPACASEET